MVLTDEQADELIFNVAMAAMLYSPDLALLDRADTAAADVEHVMRAVADVELTEEEADELRLHCGRAIVDPTAYRADFTRFVLAGVPVEAGDSQPQV